MVWKYFTTFLRLLLVIDFAGVNSTVQDPPKPLLHSNVAAVSFPTPILNSALGKWTHAFRITTKCPSQLLSNEDLIKISISASHLTASFQKANTTCQIESSVSSIKDICRGMTQQYADLVSSIDQLRLMKNDTDTEVNTFWSLLGSTQCDIVTPKTRVKRDTEATRPTNSQTADILITNINNHGDGVVQISVHSSGSQTVRGNTYKKELQRLNDHRLELPTIPTLQTPEWQAVLHTLKHKFGRTVKQEIQTLVKLIANTFPQNTTHNASEATIERRNILIQKLVSFPDQVLQELCTWKLSMAACLMKDSETNVTRFKREATLDEEPGILGWKWSLNKMIWGGLTNEDAKLINIKFQEQDTKYQNLSTYITSVINASISASDTINKEVNENLDQVRDHVNQMSSEITSWSDETNRKLETIISDQDSLEVGVLIISLRHQISQFHQNLLTIITALKELRDYYRELGTMIGQKHPLLSVLSIKNLSDALQHIRASLTKPLGVINYPNPLTLLTNIPTSCYIMGQDLIITIEVPIINTDFDYTTWRLTALPFYLKGQWLKLDTDYVGINYDISRGIWQGFTDGDIALCQSNSLNLCPFSVVTQEADATSCIHSLVVGLSDSEILCNIRSVHTPVDSNVHILPISGNEWLISVGENPVRGLRRCPDHKNVMVDTVMEFRAVTYVQLARSCTLTLGKILLMSVNMESFTSYSISKPVFASTDSIMDNINVFSTLNFSLGGNAEKQSVSLKPKFTNLTFVGDRGVTTLAKLRKYVNNQSLLLLDDTEATLKHDRFASWASDNSFLQWLPNTIFRIEIFVIGQVIIDMVLILKWVKTLLPTGWAMQQLVPANRMNGGDSFGLVHAAPIRSNLQNYPWYKAQSIDQEKKTTEDIMTTLSTPLVNITPVKVNKVKSVNGTNSKEQPSVMSGSDLSRILTAIQQARTPTSFQMDFWVMIGTMILLAILCHIFYMHETNHVIMKAISPLGLPPLNQLASHHAGEIRVILTVVLNLYPTFSQVMEKEKPLDRDNGEHGDNGDNRRRHRRSKVRVKEGISKQVAFQLCTLPGSCNDWVVTRNADASRIMEPTKGYRWLQPFKTTLRWGPICIRERQDLASTACESLPREVKIPISQIRSQISGETPFAWYKYSIVALTGIMVVGLTDSRILYTASQEPEGNELARRRGFQDIEFQ